MNIRESLSIESKYAKGKHRHVRNKFNFITEKRYLKCEIKENDEFVNHDHNHDGNRKIESNKYKNVSSFKITLNNNFIGRVNAKFTELVEVINNSKYLLDFRENWDGEGSKAYTSQTWIKSVQFLLKFYEWREQNHKDMIRPPKIYQGPEGSIDIYWKSPTFTYLINIPEETNRANYFYKSSSGTSVEGEFNITQVAFDELQQHFEKEFLL